MRTEVPTLAALDAAIRVIADDPITRRLAQPENVDDEASLWRELAACILASGISHEQAHDAMIRLEGTPVLRPGRPSEPARLERRVAARLMSPMEKLGRPLARYPFPQARARILVRAAERVYARDSSLAQILHSARSPRDARRLLIDVPGIGPKQASLFLRNTGRAADLAVLDRHIIRYMERCGLVDKQSSAGTLRGYEALEGRLATHVRQFGIALAVWDLAAWIVVRSRAGTVM